VIKIKKILPVVIFFALSVIVTFFFSGSDSVIDAKNQKLENTIVDQKITSYTNEAHEIIKLYHQDTLIGIVSDNSVVSKLVSQIYQDKYQEDFPESEVALGIDVYTVVELAYYEVENKDDEIKNYLVSNDLFSLKTNQIDFSDANGIYATIYVKNVQDFYDAENALLLNFISEDDFKTFQSNNQTPELTTYGRRTLSVNIKEKVTTSESLAKPGDIMTNYNEVLHYLLYGDNDNMEYYTVKKGDTVAGVGSLTNGLTAQQVVTINPGVLYSTDQLLEEGLELNVSYFTSPLTVEVKKERIAQEIVYPEAALYLADPDKAEGTSVVAQEESNGLKNVNYEETWVNGVLMSGVEKSSEVVVQPVQRIEYYGTKIIPGIGSGNFRYPTDNPYISCGWYCYSGHTAIDVQNRYNKWDVVRAADRGTVIQNSYTSVGGYYIRIDHHNGFITYYGHFRNPGFPAIGTNVEKGEAIGNIGMTGRATGPHTHFMISYNGVYVNPCNYLGC